MGLGEKKRFRLNITCIGEFVSCTWALRMRPRRAPCMNESEPPCRRARNVEIFVFSPSSKLAKFGLHGITR